MHERLQLCSSHQFSVSIHSFLQFQGNQICTYLIQLWLWFEVAVCFLDCICLVEKTALDKSFD